ncbi:unnamed protein product [Tuber melanosporum]|uniref:(Perigord truffle) hypothetical protein n=1 Tax=Tuber melanosporum (strain Mel28) TaxID=656061 RepID=D5G4G4_TUBMM|nr:uncharacterized protein GSTUM_00004096001 [Tuber melanosporum]KAG0138374.1 hypothetical protein HOY82DRAFT_666475 [Tuber indicum]CAZ79407.1 unnamed protein product [Tuber melanosporum]
MQFKILAIAALVAGASAATGVHNKTMTNGTVPTTTGGPGSGIGGGNNGSVPTGSGSPSGAPSSNGAYANAISGGLFGAAVAAGLTLVL